MGRADSRQRKRRATRDKLRYKQKSVRALRRRLSRAVDKWQGKGWEFVTHKDGRVLTKITFRRVKPNRRFGWWAASAGLVLLLVAGLVVALTLTPIKSDPFSEARADAAAAIQALDDGDLVAVDKQLAANVGNLDFAYFFTSKVTPRSLGDALATVAGGEKGAPFKAGVDTPAYELSLTDLAGTVALATHGTGDRALPTSWTDDFIKATTTPETLYGETGSSSDEAAKQRADEDVANKQNLLLLLSRGYWSTGFLKAVTAAYWDFDHEKGDNAWPGTTLDDSKYAPAPNGRYLTDGVLALTAALTANPAASEWAFTDFQPGTEKIDGSDYTIGKFTHYLLFEHRFPESSDGGGIGMTATLTALSSAIDATSGAAGIQAVSIAQASSNDVGPMRDSVVLQALAHDLTDESGCSWDPCHYWNCAKAGAQAVWHWIQHWGHLVLNILSYATFAPPPFSVVGIAAAATNATWYAIDDDYGMAGLSLAAAVPGLAFVKIAKGVKAGVAAEKTAAKSANVAKVAKAWRLKPWRDCSAVRPGGLSLRYGKDWTKEQRRAADEKVKAYWEKAQEGKLQKTLSQRSGTSASLRYKKAGGTVPGGADLDHTIDLQLGGIDDLSNMKQLDSSVNRSLGKQVEQQLKAFPIGQLIPTVAIC